MPADAPILIPRSPFKLGERTVEPERNRIAGPEGEVHLEPRVMDLLCALAARSGEVSSREFLINGVWGVRYGGDESLTRAVSILRKALGPGAIETIAKRGYRLAAPAMATSLPQPAVARPASAVRLRAEGRGPERVFPAESLDLWRLPPAAFAIALALAIALGFIDAGLTRGQ